MTIAHSIHYIDYGNAMGVIHGQQMQHHTHRSCYSSTQQSHMTCLLCYSSDSLGPQWERDNYIIKHNYFPTYLLN